MHDERASILYWAYDPDAPSFRYRVAHLLPALERAGWRGRVDRLPRGRHVRRVLERRRDLASADVLWLAKVRPSAGEHPLVARWASRVVFEFDDAIWLRKPKGTGRRPGSGRFRQWKFDRTCALADVVVAGNRVLGERASRRAGRVEVVPTTLDVATYSAGPDPVRDGNTAVWIGLPENLPYLEWIRPALAEIARRRAGFRLRVVCSRFPDWPEVPVERVPWSSEGEIAALRSADVGIMPLSDDPWTRGKCAFKLIQYMAAGLPCVASPVGANRDAVVHGDTGYLADAVPEWTAALDRLFGSEGERRTMGERGRVRASVRYDRGVAVNRVLEILDDLSAGRGRVAGR